MQSVENYTCPHSEDVFERRGVGHSSLCRERDSFVCNQRFAQKCTGTRSLYKLHGSRDIAQKSFEFGLDRIGPSGAMGSLL